MVNIKVKAHMVGWTYLAFAIVTEVTGTVALRYSKGFTVLFPTISMAVCYGLSFYLMSLALKYVPLSVTYAVWSGVGTALVALIGFLALGETATMFKIFSIALIIVGVISLNLAGGH